MESETKPNGKFIKGQNYYRGKRHSNWRGGITGNYKLQYLLRKQRHPEKVKAQKTLSYAVSSGKVKKPNTCERCSNIFPRNNIQGHHENYNEPLFVKWLCRKCHSYIHRGHKKSS